MFFRSKKPGVSWIVVFLGNPGREYYYTRHNAGFMAGDAMAKRRGIKIDRLKYKALTARCDIGGQSVFLMKPQTFMNLSGTAVSQAMSFFKVPLDHVLVVSDDISLPVGRLRVRRGGSAGGHNGLKDIIAKCGGQDFPRIKIGVGGPPHPDYDVADWVLSTFKDSDAQAMELASDRASAAVEVLITQGVDAAMNQFNG